MTEKSESESEKLEPTLDVETTPRMEPNSVLACEVPTAGAPPKKYWQAQSFASTMHSEFETLRKKGDFAGMRNRFYLLAYYYGRTLGILRQALLRGREPLINTALRNLVTLHQPLHHMHEVAPILVPFALTLDKQTRRQLTEDLIIEVLQEASEPLAVDTITSRVKELQFILGANINVIQTLLENLIEKDYVQKVADGYTRTKRAYSSINLDRASLQALLGPKLYQEFERKGFQGLSNIVNQKEAFQEFFAAFVGCGSEMTEMFIATSVELLRLPSSGVGPGPWRHADLIGSLYPRPYQFDAYAIFRGHGYKGEVIEAPTGSGKTMIGMMCIQDWFRTMSRGQSILILVPTVNYEQQWVGELCYKPIGLQLTPDEVFTGTPAALEMERKDSGLSPAILIMTYTALAQLGSPTGKGGFDRISIEKFLQGNNIRFVILDEVHKVVEDLKSVSANVTSLLTEWLRDGSLQGLIGFSGTAAAYRDKFAKLGLELVYVMPAADLIAYGFVAPFAEFGVPFTYSDREKQVMDLLEQYKSLLIKFINAIGGDTLRKLFGEIPIEKRVAIGRDILGMYADRKDQDEALAKRYKEWERLTKFTLNELPLITIIQIVNGLSDKALLENSLVRISEQEQENTRANFQEILQQVMKIREELKELVYFPDIVKRLSTGDFGTAFDAENLRTLSNKPSSIVSLQEQVKNKLATSIVGLYTDLKSFYYRVGEGRVDSIKSIIEAELSTRKVTGVIIFDLGRRIRLAAHPAIPGYSGVAGVFAQMLGDKRFTPLAVLSGEIYMPWTEKNQLPSQIANYVKEKIMLSELGGGLFKLATHGVEMPADKLTWLQGSCQDILADYIQRLSNIGAPRPGEFNRKVLLKLRKAVAKAKLGETGEKVRSRLTLKSYHVHKWVNNFFDYALIANRFFEAKTTELRQANGTLQKFFVVKMAEGDRKQLMYDLTSRIFDAEDLLVNVIIVSPWARTGWNVVKPNVLIDATATRNVTAWQQLRGRAMRALRTWNKECYELAMVLLGSHMKGVEKTAETLLFDATIIEELRSKQIAADTLSENAQKLLLEVHSQQPLKTEKKEFQESSYGLAAKIRSGKLKDFTEDERDELATELMLTHNKVTHIYELVKAYGSTMQVRLDRASQEWRRTDSIAAKHAQEYSVSPISGQYGAGETHAPLIYSQDPRKNLPSQLKAHMSHEIRNRDQLIVNGWIKAVISRVEEDVGLG